MRAVDCELGTRLIGMKTVNWFGEGLFLYLIEKRSRLEVEVGSAEQSRMRVVDWLLVL